MNYAGVLSRIVHIRFFTTPRIGIHEHFSEADTFKLLLIIPVECGTHTKGVRTTSWSNFREIIDTVGIGITALQEVTIIRQQLPGRGFCRRTRSTSLFRHRCWMECGSTDYDRSFDWWRCLLRWGRTWTDWGKSFIG
jgi:hypothetical protein